ncbi:MAG: tripartite tricarboxylate transporter permease [Desulfovibrio sp.]|jgi:putative tricarboxylic transport membrane protein|nr:tripartite tricarboxylate transporter permease [Desulfovibrio sp.]
MNEILIGIQFLFSDPVNVFLFFAALFGGLFFGALPGISVVTLGAMILPFTMYLTATQAIMIYAVMYCSGTYGGAVMAILFNIPGAAENAPTAFDGYPLTKQGKAGKAIGAAVVCSALGGIFSCILMMAGTQYIARWAISAFGPPEMFALIFFAVAVSSTVGAKSALKGWISVCIGLVLATVGTDPVGGTYRYTFNTIELTAGIHYLALILGFFSISEVFAQAGKAISTKPVPPKIKIEFPGIEEFWMQRVNILRSSLIGFFCGLLPGIGTTLAAFMSYSEAKRWSKNPENFGKGELSGVVASETGNNAATGGAMVPMLALGLPGGAVTAMMISVFMIHGLEPGPLIMVQQHDLVWTVFICMLLANLCILFLGYVETKTIVNLLRIPTSYLTPTIFILSTVGAYAIRNSVFDVWVMLIAGLVGFVMKKRDYSPAGIILGSILGSLGEAALAKSMQMGNYNWNIFFTRSASCVFMILGICSIIYTVHHARCRLKRNNAKAAP